MEQLEKKISQYGKLNPEREDYIFRIIDTPIFKKREMALRETSYFRPLLFVKEGLLRVFSSPGEKEVTTWLLQENEFCIEPISFFQGGPAMGGIQALERTVVSRIYYHQLEDVCRRYPDFEAIVSRIKSEYYARAAKREIDRKGLTPEERYACMEENEPDLMKRVDATILCSYLGMSLSLFNAIRNGRATKNYKKRKG